MGELQRLKTSGLFGGGASPSLALRAPFTLPLPAGAELRVPSPQPSLAEPKPSRRRKIWELGASLHCSIIGTCLSTTELRQALVKLGVADAATASDHLTHKQGVTLAGKHDARSKLLNKTLDLRHRLTIKQFESAKTDGEVADLWRDSVQRGEIPGAYWAVLTHPATSEELIKDAFGEVHMLSHLVGAANRADIRRLAALETEKAELEAKIARQQEQLRSAVTTRDETIRDLSSLLARKIAEEPSTERDTPHADSSASEPATLSKLVADLERRLATESRRRATVEERLAARSAELESERTQRGQAEATAGVLREELDSIEERLAAMSADPDEALDAALDATSTLDGLSILYVGGRPNQVNHMRALSERFGAGLLHHDGGIEDHGTRLAGLVSRCDIVLFPVDCVSHAAMSVVKKLCRQSGKPYLPLRASGLGSFIAVLGRPEMVTAAGRRRGLGVREHADIGMAPTPF